MRSPSEAFGENPTLRKVSAVTAVCVLLMGGAHAHGPPTGEPSTGEPAASALPQIQVEAQRRSVEKRVRTFVAAITPRDFADSLVRWHRGICPTIVGPSQDQSDLILNHLSAISAAAGVPIQPKSCNANLYIIESPFPVQLLQAWRKRDRLLFGDAPSATLQRFLDSPRPVRVCYNTLPGGEQHQG